ncbi:MAG: hypothetical protein A2X12_02100 [Bacteroidetes bacterium GWE2_29_8]|nr:MAG: hypothetical protein A2X12_02100 [Bacteroidetes bacterium GWE2_29_8]
MSELKSKNTIKSYLSFSLGKEKFAAHVDKVLNILEMRPITKVPQAPDYMNGVINLRGNVLPIIDLRIKFGIEDKSFTVDTCIIVLSVKLDDEVIMLGALVDEVNEVLELSENDIEPAPSIGSKYNPEFIKGMHRVNENFIMILNIDHVFATDNMLIEKKQEENIEVINN